LGFAFLRIFLCDILLIMAALPLVHVNLLFFIKGHEYCGE